MSLRTIIAILACVLWLSPSISGADFNAGVEAFSRGDYAVALEEFKQAARDGDARAINNLGFMYLNGAGVPYDAQIAVAYFEQAVNEHSDVFAMANLGWLQVTGEGTEKDLSSGVSLLQTASRMSVPSAQYYLALLYQTGHGVDRDFVQMCQLVIKAADSGYPDAQTAAGICYEDGISVPKDLQVAVDYFRRAAETHNDSGARVSLARLLIEGIEIEQDYEEAYRLLRQSEDQNAVAGILLGDMYFFGSGVEQSDQTAISLYERALAEIEKIQVGPNRDWFYVGLSDAPFVESARTNLFAARQRSGVGAQTDESSESIESITDQSAPRTATAVIPETARGQVTNASNDRTTDAPSSTTVNRSVTQLPNWDNYSGISGSELSQTDYPSKVAQASRPTIYTYTLLLAGTLMPVMFIYALTFLIFCKSLGLRYSALSFLIGFVVAWILAAILVLVLGQPLYEAPGSRLLIWLIPSTAVIWVMLLRQKRVGESVNAGERKFSRDMEDASGQEQQSIATSLENRSHELGPMPLRNNTVQRGIGWILLILSALGMVMCSTAGPDMRGFVMSPSGAWVWLLWLAMLIGGVIMKQR